MAALRRYPLEKGRKLTFEYILIRDFNDPPATPTGSRSSSPALRAKVNLIPINPDPVLGTRMVPPDDERIEAFKDRLRQRGLIATVRRRCARGRGARPGQRA